MPKDHRKDFPRCPTTYHGRLRSALCAIEMKSNPAIHEQPKGPVSAPPAPQPPPKRDREKAKETIAMRERDNLAEGEMFAAAGLGVLGAAKITADTLARQGYSKVATTEAFQPLRETVNAEGRFVRKVPGFSVPAGEVDFAAETAVRSGVVRGAVGAVSLLNPVVDAVSFGLLAGAAALGIGSAITGAQLNKNTLREMESNPRTGFDY